MNVIYKHIFVFVALYSAHEPCKGNQSIKVGNDTSTAVFYTLEMSNLLKALPY